MTNLILCGGAGTRLWPLSRNARPKQFQPIFDGRTLFEDTVLRNRSLVDRYWVASNEVQMPLAAELLAKHGVADYGQLVEPVGRNTAPAIALVCLALPRDEIVFVTPSDHRISDVASYSRAVERAKELAEQGYLVTFGITPTYPETGFGYIEADGEVVKQFHEKPDPATAKAYVESGHYFWNSGMFVFRAGEFLDGLAQHSPEVFATAKAAFESSRVGRELRPDVEAMKTIPALSIDYALMEKSERVRVVACDPGWSDLGSLEALYDEVAKDVGHNGSLGVDPLFISAKGNLVVSDKRVVLSGVDDLLVIDTKDALLVMRRGQGQSVREVVARIREVQPDLL